MEQKNVIIVVGVAVLLLAGIGGGTFWYIQNNQGSLSLGAKPTPAPTEDPGVQVIVAKIDIKSDTIIDNAETYLDKQKLSTSEYNLNSTDYLISSSDVEGKQITEFVGSGEKIRKKMLIEPGLSQKIPPKEADRPRRKAYPIEVNAFSGVADMVTVNDFVDIIATFPIPVQVQQAPQEPRYEWKSYLSTKTIVQRAKVLRILRRPPGMLMNEKGTPIPEAPTAAAGKEPTAAGPPAVGPDGKPLSPAAQGANQTEGSYNPYRVWMLVLAVTDQEAELMEFTKQTEGGKLSLVLRGAGDDAFDSTVGGTLNLLLSDFGLPKPQQPKALSDQFSPGKE